jgi:hypothetical protein
MLPQQERNSIMALCQHQPAVCVLWESKQLRRIVEVHRYPKSKVLTSTERK